MSDDVTDPDHRVDRFIRVEYGFFTFECQKERRYLKVSDPEKLRYCPFCGHKFEERLKR